ncbi:uncharacterized protein EAE97_010810 [Botrytis byssoidea]|uniref:FAD-binding domain-containing protein n=1 Tax=Botrytis byssoidea TaxID=139641 RepID=A0A9P5HYD5_9HELO|nr:uncharacterized protein EAE97_010810 [Botrytis byssoidea]KAF7924198.1 hypothetical protein EAE97_010810 [Botrytis byssoidea]
MLNANKLELDRWKYRLPGPSLTPGPTTIKKIEAMMIERAESLGVAILRDKAVNKIAAQSEIGITVKTGDDASYSSRWLIEKSETWIHLTKTGVYIVAGMNCLHLVGFDGAIFDRRQGITREHLQDVMNRVTGITDLEITTVHLLASYTDRSKQAKSYRKGRFLLAGDAAHIHSPLGARALNVGLGDAMNLGWKLATTIRQEAISNKNSVVLTLLNTYENKRQGLGS